MTNNVIDDTIKDIISRNNVFGWLAIGTVVLLLVPLLLMLFQVPLFDPGSGMEVLHWSVFDFVLMGVLIFGTGSLFVLIARKFPKKNQRITIALLLLIAFLWLWAELAVGVFTNLGN